ncbi:MAG: dephospho-CoA kinase [Verrucomicrobia bacterium]|nr:dephospho-CoA kinase [Verrucomicrobiota bacterium]
MRLFGLTGGIGMGKSTAGEWLRRRGVPVADTDQIARELVEPGQPALEEIRRAFGGEFISAKGGLLRQKLAQHVFANAPARRQLEDILHPRIRAVWLAQVAAWRQEGRPSAVVLIPLLFETAAASCFDASICVACSAATQRRRLLERDWAAEEIDQRNLAQWPIDKKIAAADFVVWTEGPLEVCAEQLERIPGLVLDSGARVCDPQRRCC